MSSWQQESDPREGEGGMEETGDVEGEGGMAGDDRLEMEAPDPEENEPSPHEGEEGQTRHE